ncbi:imidazolonepropionase [Curvivirga sp.]|uniref:imidazolonepropionase n=1 Tax=Curvivirga sp. TaxID=2856848 RepID=UPI003B58F9E6
MWQDLWINISIATMTEAPDNSGFGQAYGMIEDGAFAVHQGKIVFAGKKDDLPSEPANLAVNIHDGNGGCVTPGLVDCHTHLVYGGNRATEFEMRLKGASYEEIAKAGGGIVSTVSNTRAASEDELYQSAHKRLSRLMEEGVTTVEIKSGYGLDTENEAKMLRVARKLGSDLPVDVKTTFLGAHALPAEFKDREDDYISLVCDEMLPTAVSEGLVDCVDAFCEGIAFNPEQTARVFEAAKKHNLPVKLHADQLSDLNGAGLAARYKALSADHLEYTNEEAVKAMATSGTVAVLLPGAFYVLKETKLPPMDAFREHNVPIALATDSNPGSSPVTSILLMLSMGCRYFALTPEEAFKGITVNAAKALGVFDQVGSLDIGKVADFVIWDIQTPAELAYNVGVNPAIAIYKDGVQR